MFEKIVAKLKAEGVEIVSGENGVGKTELASEYLSLVAGGTKGSAAGGLQFLEDIRNSGDTGGPGGGGNPYWQSITRPDY